MRNPFAMFKREGGTNRILNQIIVKQTIADATLDRILYSAHRINLKGESMRKKIRKYH